MTLLFAACLCGIGISQAQELPFPIQSQKQAFHPSDFRSITHKPTQLQFNPAFPLHPQQPLEEGWEKRIEIQKTALKRIMPAKKDRNFRVEVQVWSAINTGNYVNNWSPFPDRALDARTLSMPLPKRLVNKFPVK